jgi:hypothetical protein
MHQDNLAKVWQLRCTMWQEHWNMMWLSFELRATNMESKHIDSKEEENTFCIARVYTPCTVKWQYLPLATFSWIPAFVIDPTFTLLCPNSGQHQSWQLHALDVYQAYLSSFLHCKVTNPHAKQLHNLLAGSQQKTANLPEGISFFKPPLVLASKL